MNANETRLKTISTIEGFTSEYGQGSNELVTANGTWFKRIYTIEGFTSEYGQGSPMNL